MCTEEVTHALELMGYQTAVDLPLLIASAKRLPHLIGHDVPSQILKAGRRLAPHPPLHDFQEIRARALSR